MAILLRFVGEGLIWANVIFSALLAYYSLIQFLKTRRRPEGFILFLIGAYWTALYIYVGMNNLGVGDPRNHETWSQIWFRPAFTFTLAFMLASILKRQAKQKAHPDHSEGKPDVR